MINHSAIQTYLDCQKKWDLIYNKGHTQTNIHFAFGTMGHTVLETREIPNEELYPELKEAFGIKSWNKYFTAILEEIDLRMSEYTQLHQELKLDNGIIRGTIDAVWIHNTTGRYLITDYKFSTKDKDVVDVSIDEQMYLYGLLYAQNYDIPLDLIDTGYINIPKTQLDEPRILMKGGLSKDKAQNVTHKAYLAKIQELGLNEADYEDILSDLAGKTLIQITITSMNQETLIKIIENIENVMKDMKKGYLLEKFSFMCKYCDLYEYCKKGKHKDV